MLEAAPILPVLPGPDATEAMAPAVLCAHGRRISDAVDLIRGRRQYQITVRSARPNAWSDGGAKIAAAALTALDPVLDDSIRLPSDGPDLALNLVVLVPADAEAAMEAAINTFDRDVGGLKITLLGPLPPISFHAARIRALDAKVLARAARRLGVEAGSRLDIGVAFRRFAGARHPDRGGPDKIDFAELVAARDTMREADKLRAALRAAGCPEPDAGLPALDIVRDGGAGGVSQMADRPRAA
ncbi:MAG: GvpL/GvpF family gas vesicle protein [Paracoccaceae bacterium]